MFFFCHPAISLGTRSTPEQPWTKAPPAAGMGDEDRQEPNSNLQGGEP